MELASQELRGIPVALKAVAALIDPKRKTRCGAPREIKFGLAAPPGPGARAVDIEPNGALRPGQCGDRAMIDSENTSFKLEPVAVRLCVEMDERLVIAAQPGSKVHERSTRPH